ncbi:hypothetical protein EV421DRAFT_1345426 [Armillaria borealis]|uniref:Uncharacterized protein n=1 Tax=Armillaria borealis TaxID=47425 RepID=A0AA39J4S0_9AGAR|nr:hypothetical protein EV421DRAFT_1345426 [Armillaria borealis]
MPLIMRASSQMLMALQSCHDVRRFDGNSEPPFSNSAAPGTDRLLRRSHRGGKCKISLKKKRTSMIGFSRGQQYHLKLRLEHLYLLKCLKMHSTPKDDIFLATSPCSTVHDNQEIGGYPELRTEIKSEMDVDIMNWIVMRPYTTKKCLTLRGRHAKIRS